MNKTVKLISWFCAIIGTIVVFSCRKDISNMFSDNTNAGTKWAQDYFNNTLLRNQGNQVSYKTLNAVSSVSPVKRSPNMKTPMWVRARADKTPLYEFVEIPLLYTRKISSIIGKKDAPADMEVLTASFDRLIIFKDRTGRIGQRIISFIPDKDYLKRHNGDISHNQINHLDKDFSGYLIYKAWDGTTLTRLRINNGKPGKFPRSSNALPAKLNKLASLPGAISDHYGSEGDPGCTDYYDVQWEIVCYYASPDETIPIYCDDPVIVYQHYLYTVCPDEDPDPDPDPGPPDGGCADPANFESPACENPCNRALALTYNQGFKNKFTDNKNRADTSSTEGAYVGVNGSYTFIQGGADSVDINITSPVDEVFHNHTSAPDHYPTFDMFDVGKMYEIYHDGNVADTSDFAFGISTPYGNYMLLIENPTLFSTYGASNLATQSMIQNFNDNVYDLTYSGLKLLYEHQKAGELTLLGALANSGLTLFKGNTDVSSWQKIIKDGSNVVNSNCN